MQEAWLNPINNDTDILVPTRSLATELAHQISEFHIQNKHQTWRTPTILTWHDFLEQLFENNRLALSDYSEQQPASQATVCLTGSSINSQQAAMLWTRVIENTKREESELALLNVQQTVRAVMRSWKLMHDWQLDLDLLSSSHIGDAVQFAGWCEQYQQQLADRNLIDEPLMLEALCRLGESQQLNHQSASLDIYAFDLLTLSQSRFLRILEQQGLPINHSGLAERRQVPNEYYCFPDHRAELRSAFREARHRLEENPEYRINIVVPELQKSRALVEELAADVFYPGRPPIELLNNNLAYRFSLGKSLLDWPATAAANSILKLLRGRVKLSHLRNCLRSRFSRTCRTQEATIENFLFWLQSNRYSYIQISELHDLAQAWLLQEEHDGASSPLLDFLRALDEQFSVLQDDLEKQFQSSGYRALSFLQWRRHFVAWLDCWGWSTSTDADNFGTVQFQLAEKWTELLVQLMSLSMVQRQAGLSTALDVLHRMLRDTVFLPKAVDSPILISGMYEAIGRPADLTWLVGMDDRFPSVTDNDPFIGHQLRQVEAYPGSTTLRQVEQANSVVESLLSSSAENIISYSLRDDEDADLLRESSALFRNERFGAFSEDEVEKHKQVSLERYIDGCGPRANDASRLRGGTRIFEDQSNCAFRAFVTHRLHYTEEEEIEFGLDHFDRGNIVHLLLERIWREIGSQDQLIRLMESKALGSLVRESIEVLIEELGSSESLTSTFNSPEKRALLEMEGERLYALAIEWLNLEAKRPIGFSVIEREERRRAEIGGIGFRYAIDRVDILDDQRTLIIDYKTGASARSDWKGPRVKKPQLPLYALALEKLKNKAPSGIAVGQIKRYNSKYEELAEAGMFQRRPSDAKKYEEAWQEAATYWPSYFEALANEFIQGEASVNPIEDATCQYCNLKAVCRISQLRAQSGQFVTNGSAADSGED